MLKLAALALLLVGTFAHADEAQYQLPEKINCTSKGRAENVRSFSISKLNTSRPDISIPDAGLMEELEDTYAVQLGFSNECDNSYSVFLYGSDLSDLREGKLKSVNGLLNYSNEDLDYSYNDQKPHEETVVLTCTLAK